MGAITKKELKIIKEFGDNPNYRIETNSKNQIVAVQLKPDNSLERFAAGTSFTLNKDVSVFTKIKYNFDPASSTVVNNDGADEMEIVAAFRDGFIVKRAGRESRIINFSSVNFASHDK